MITICSCCNQDSAGNHEWGCPCSPKTYPGKQADDVVASLYQRIATLEADLARVTGEMDALHRFAHGVMIACVEAGGRGGDTTVQLSNVRHLVKERDTLRVALTRTVEALQGLLSQKIAVDGEPHAFWNHNAPSLWVTEYRRGQDALAHAQAVLADK